MLREGGGRGPMSAAYQSLAAPLYRLLCSLPLGKMGEVTVSFLGGVEPEQCFRLVQ